MSDQLIIPGFTKTTEHEAWLAEELAAYKENDPPEITGWELDDEMGGR